MRSRPKFSMSWCILIAVLHAFGTIGLVLLNFVLGMGAFTSDGYQIGGLLWIWSPLAMIAGSTESMNDDTIVLFLGFLWSVIIGTIGGLWVPYLRRNRVVSEVDKSPYSDLAGTPWENDPSYISSPSKSKSEKSHTK